ncbi:MAG: hypothetical protein IK109_06540 [Clostridiales bacterium]|nr:hypothetical protein [Clostridiales bacterium]
MQGRITSKPHRIVAGILSMLVLFIVVFSAFYVAMEAGHDCCAHEAGHECPICECLEKCEAVLSVFKSISVRSVHAVFSVIVLLAIAHFESKKISPETPVSSKVQLNN